MGYLANLLVKIGVDNREFNAGMDSATRSVNRFATDLQSAGSRLSLGISAPLIAAGAAAIKAAGDMEQTKVAFTTLLKSADEAGKHIQQLKQFALTTPFQFDDLTKASRLMQAYGFAAQDVVPKLRTIGNAVSALGGGSDVLERVVRSLGEIGTRGKITGEQLRELSRAGIPALEAVAKKLGVSVAEAQKQVTAGTVDAKTAMDAILEYMNTRFKGGMEAQSQTVLGSWSNIKDKLKFTLAEIGEALRPITKNIITNFADPALEKVKLLAEGFSKLPVPVQNTAIALGGALVVLPLATVALGAIATSLISVGGVLPKVGAAIEGLGNLFAAFGSQSAGLAAGLSQQTNMFGMATGAMKGAGAAYAAMVATGILRAGVWIGLAAAVWKAVEAIHGLGEAQDGLRDAGKTQEQKLEQLEKSLLMRAAGNKELVDRLTELRKAYIGGSMGDHNSPQALAAYLRYLQQIAQQLGTNIAEEQKHAVTLVDINKLLTDAGLKTMEQRRKDLEQAKELYAAVVKEYGVGSVIAAEALKKLQDAQAALIPSIAEVKERVSGIPFEEKSFQAAILVEKVKLLRLEQEKYIAEVAKAGSVEAYNAQQAAKLAEAMKLLANPPEVKGFGDFGADFQKLLDSTVKLPPELQRVADAMKVFGLESDRANVPLLERNFDILGQAFEDGTIEIDTYIQAWIRLVKAMDAAGQPISEGARREVIRLEKEYGGQIRQTRKEQNEFQREVDRTFDALARGLARSIVDWKGWGAAIKNVAKDLAAGFLEIMIRQLIKPLQTEFAKLAGWLGQLLHIGGGGATKAGTTIIDETGNAVDIGSGASSSAASGLMGTIGAVGAAVGAVSSVVGNFQMAGMNKSLDVLVNHTLRIFNVVYQMLDEHYLFKGQLFQKMDDMWRTELNIYDWLGKNGGAGGGNAKLGLTFNNCNFNGTPEQNAAAIFQYAQLAGAI